MIGHLQKIRWLVLHFDSFEPVVVGLFVKPVSVKVSTSDETVAIFVSILLDNRSLYISVSCNTI